MDTQYNTTDSVKHTRAIIIDVSKQKCHKSLKYDDTHS